MCSFDEMKLHRESDCRTKRFMMKSKKKTHFIFMHMQILVYDLCLLTCLRSNRKFLQCYFSKRSLYYKAEWPHLSKLRMTQDVKLVGEMRDA